MKLLFTVDICERFIYIFPDQSAYSAEGKYVDRSWEYINCSQIHEWGKLGLRPSNSQKGIHKWDFPCSTRNGTERRAQVRPGCSIFDIIMSSCCQVLKVVTSKKVGGSGVTSTLGTLCGGRVMGILLSFDEAAILYGVFNIAPP